MKPRIITATLTLVDRNYNTEDNILAICGEAVPQMLGNKDLYVRPNTITVTASNAPFKGARRIWINSAKHLKSPFSANWTWTKKQTVDSNSTAGFMSWTAAKIVRLIGRKTIDTATAANRIPVYYKATVVE